MWYLHWCLCLCLCLCLTMKNILSKIFQRIMLIFDGFDFALGLIAKSFDFLFTFFIHLCRFIFSGWKYLKLFLMPFLCLLLSDCFWELLTSEILGGFKYWAANIPICVKMMFYCLAVLLYFWFYIDRLFFIETKSELFTVFMNCLLSFMEVKLIKGHFDICLRMNLLVDKWHYYPLIFINWLSLH